MSDLDSIRVFLVVAQSGSFTEAARTLDVSVSSVSRQVSALEKGLGIALFTRTTRSLSLTEAGAMFESGSRELVKQLDELREAVSTPDREPSGTLRVSAPLALGRLHVASAAIKYMERWPKVKVELELTDKIVDLVDSNIDVGIRIGLLTDSSMVAKRLGSVKRFVYASPEYLAKFGVPETPEELVDHSCLTFQPYELSPLWRDTLDRWRFSKDNELIEVPVDGPLRVNASEVLVQAALQGKGLFLMLDWVVSEHVREGRLQAVLEDYVAAPYQGDAAAYAVYPEGRSAPLKVREFLSTLDEYFKENLRTN